MMNIIRADIYRILRGKAFYITLAILLAMVAIQIIAYDHGTFAIGINSDAIDFDNLQDGIDGSSIAGLMLASMDNLIYFLIPIFIVVAASMFSCGAVKNSLSSGISRVKMYLSALLLSSVMCLLLMVAYWASSVLLASAIRGLGDWTVEHLVSILKAFGAQAVLLLAFNAVGVFLSFVTRSTAAVNGIYIAFALVPALVVAILSEAYESFTKYYNYDMTMCMKLFSVYIDTMPSADIMRGLAVGVFWMLASTIAGLALFKKAEIK